MSIVERWNALTHGAGAVGFAVAVTILLATTSIVGDPWKITSIAIYGVTLVALYTSSAVYHSLTGRAKAICRKIDHTSIYLLIAGTYTPFLLGPLRGPWGWTLLAIVWTLAVIGIIQDWWQLDRRRILSLVLYIGMGWLVVVAIGPLMRALPAPALWWILAGGLAYTGGVAFYVVDHRWPSAHVAWHLCVIAGSACHFVAIARYVA
ncbi:MAG: hemolysin III family protein [Acidobacteria bacterium]|nr:hemolysin III family protein [Acidobacteriota bacterium]